MQDTDKTDFQLEIEAKIAQFKSQREERPSIEGEDPLELRFDAQPAPAHPRPR